MAENTWVQWADITWNWARGCHKVDEDCKFCYMYRDSFDSTRYNPFDVVKTKTVFNLPLKVKQRNSNVWPGRPLVFTCSLTDWALPEIDEYRAEAWKIIKDCPHFIFQMLTKRPERIPDILPKDWGNGYENVWFGTSAGSENIKSLRRIYTLVLNPEPNLKFLSLEPLHGKIDTSIILHSGKINWVIVGGESGNNTGKYGYRPCKLEWIENIVNDCKAAQVPVFVKQLGTHLSKEMGLKDRHGGDMNEWPEHLQVRQFPNSNFY